MPRTDSAAVLLILETSLESTQVDAFIADANLWVTQNLVPEGQLSDDELKIIEKYLAAHFATSRDPRVTEGELGDVRERYQRDSKMTEYLKIAIAMDTTGVVAAKFADPERKGRVRWRVGQTFTHAAKHGE